MYGEVGCLIRYFQKQLFKNSSFYHANQMDTEEQITNVFCAYARILIYYEYFSDVVSLDNTHCNWVLLTLTISSVYSKGSLGKSFSYGSIQNGASFSSGDQCGRV